MPSINQLGVAADHVCRHAAKQHQDESPFGPRVREPNRAAFPLPVLLNDIEAAITPVEFDRGIEVAHVQRAMGESGRHAWRSAAATASRIVSNCPKPQ